jgi:Ca2+-dependent lipid-binding protein
LLVNNLTESLIFTVWDYNDHRKNTELGQATFDLNKLNDDAVWEGQEVPIFMDGKDRGLLRFDVSFYPVLPPVITVEGAEEELPETSKLLSLSKALLWVAH